MSRERVVVPAGNGPLTWARFDAGKSERVYMTCKCGCTAELDHEIDEHGNVEPSMECPNGCGFHEHVRLAGYQKINGNEHAT